MPVQRYPHSIVLTVLIINKIHRRRKLKIIIFESEITFSFFAVRVGSVGHDNVACRTRTNQIFL